jgi:hypothetical protein
MADEEGKKGHKKGLFAALLAAVAGVLFFMKKKKKDGEESGWEEARPNV